VTERTCPEQIRRLYVLYKILGNLVCPSCLFKEKKFFFDAPEDQSQCLAHARQALLSLNFINPALTFTFKTSSLHSLNIMFKNLTPRFTLIYVLSVYLKILNKIIHFTSYISNCSRCLGHINV
jgi:hypothetical protein